MTQTGSKTVLVREVVSQMSHMVVADGCTTYQKDVGGSDRFATQAVLDCLAILTAKLGLGFRVEAMTAVPLDFPPDRRAILYTVVGVAERTIQAAGA